MGSYFSFLTKDLIVKHSAFLMAFIATLIFALSPAHAGDDHISIGAGYYNIVDDDDHAADFRLEYRWGDPLFWQINPYVGVEVNSQGSVWGGFGLFHDFFITDHVYITPSTSVGLYHNSDGDDKDLGHPIEFRSQIELGYQFENYHRVSASFGHISNASLDSHNPGTEILNAYYHIPWN